MRSCRAPPGECESVERARDEREVVELVDAVRGALPEGFVLVTRTRDVLRIRFQPEVLQRGENNRRAAPSEPRECGGEPGLRFDQAAVLRVEVAGGPQPPAKRPPPCGANSVPPPPHPRPPF